MRDLNIDIDHLKSWIGREVNVVDDLSPFKAKALHAALNISVDQLPLPEKGSDLALPWHWMYFVDTPTGANTGVDGHGKTGDFLPPIPLPRRMWAAGNFLEYCSLKLGVPAIKQSIISEIDLKKGSSGSLVFVTVLHKIYQNDNLCVEEEQTIVYREMPNGPSPIPDGKKPEKEPSWSEIIFPDPVLLFRFSALTYNGHRIHYDKQYAVEKEFYPGLVVHGPLQATVLANSITKHNPKLRLRDLKFRAIRPLFDSKPIQVCGVIEGNNVDLWTTSHDGFIGMSATATISEKE